jgi:hypothetical protein
MKHSLLAALLAAAAAAALLAASLATPAAAWDNDPASFRADPQAWVRKTLMPGCGAPTDDKTTAMCACAVRVMAAMVTEADVARVNEPDFAKTFMAKVFGVALGCKETARPQ